MRLRPLDEADVVLAAGTSPTGAPGPILIQAWSELAGDDTATLKKHANQLLDKIGKSVPLPMTQMVYGPGGTVVSRGTQYVDVGSGFSVRPQLAVRLHADG